MQHAVCIVSVCPMRSEPSHKSEMVSQLLFGEAAEIIETDKEFIKIKCLYDDYEGWVGKRRVETTDTEFSFSKPKGYTDAAEQHVLVNDAVMRLSLATPVFEAGYFGKHKVEYFAENMKPLSERKFTAEEIVQVSTAYLNTSYLWGGKSSFGIDCSGFTQQVFKMFQKKLLRDAYQQATQGETVNSLEYAQTGDLAFFDNSEGRITHAGILKDKETIIHASSWVRIDKIDKDGIINIDTGERTHHLSLIKRI